MTVNRLLAPFTSTAPNTGPIRVPRPPRATQIAASIELVGDISLGLIAQQVSADLTVTVEENEVHVARHTEDKEHKAQHGLYRALLHNMVVGVSEGYVKKLELVGVGFRASNQGNLIEFALGYTHNIFLQLPKEIKVETKSERNQNPLIILESCDKQLLGQVCAKIRSFRMPEPYKGKGVLFVGEQIRRKSGKSAGAK